MLLEQKVLLLNHIFEDNIKEYRICEENIEVNLQVKGNKLKGEAMIGDIILCFNEEHQTQLIFPKEKMNLNTIG